MKNLLIPAILTVCFLLISGCSKEKKQSGAPSSSQEQNLSGGETPSDPDHVSGNSSGSNISGK